jgi:hypothetical protein
MKNIVIRIKDRSEIDTSRISVYDLNNRYVDDRGEWYCLKYNRDQKKIEVIKLLRASAGEMQQIKQKIATKKTSEPAAAEEAPVEAPAERLHVREETEIRTDDTEFNAEHFISDCVSGLFNHKTRISSIIKSVKNTNLIHKDNKTDSIELDDICRNIEIDAIQGIEKLENYQKELINYPRSPNYYTAKLDRRGKDIYDLLAGSENGRIMRFIYRYEMFNLLVSIYDIVEKLISRLKEFIDAHDNEDTSSMPHFERQQLSDAKTSIDNTLNDIHRLKNHFETLREHVYNIDLI